MVAVVVADCSTYGRKLNEYLACSNSGTTHQLVASATAQAQHATSAIKRRPRTWVRMNSPGKSSTSSVDVALTPPMPNTATPDWAAAFTNPPPRVARTSGTTAQSASRPGSRPAEDDPIKIVKVGHEANASPATTRDRSVPILSTVASLTMPPKPTATSSESQSRSVNQTGSWSNLPIR